MDDESRNELEGLVVSFLQSCLNEYRYGVPLNYFERFFPEKTDEARDWYVRFKARNPLEALRSIPKAVIITNDRRTNGLLISLNQTSDKADALLQDLIVGQKSSVKRKKPFRATSQRVLDSYSMNRQGASSASYNTQNRFRAQIGDQGQSRSSYSSSNRSSYPKPPPPDTYTFQRLTSQYEPPPRMAPADPRNRQSSHMTPPQVRPPSVRQPPTTPSRPLNAPTSSLQTFSVGSSASVAQQSENQPVTGQRRVQLDPSLEHKRSHLRQRLIQLLMKKSAEIKLLYLPYLYFDDYSEELDPTIFGHKSISSLLQEPFFSEYFRIDYKDVFSTVSLKIIGVNDKPVSPAGGNTPGVLQNKSTNCQGPFGDKTKSMTDIQKKFNAIDAFNISNMIQCLEPLKAQEPVLGKNQIEDIILFRTMRLILTGDNQTLKLEEWERKYQQAWNYNNRIRISDYGCRTLLEFFKVLATELPIKTHLIKDEWVAKSSVQEIKDWVNKKLNQGKYKVLIVHDPKYDQVAYPGDSYPLSTKMPPGSQHHRAMIMSVDNNRMWLQVREPEWIRDHLAIETSLTCYEDHKRKEYFKVSLALVKVGFPCVAFDEAQQRWCRAMLIAVPSRIEKDSVVTAFLVDYAITKRFSISQLSCILRNHLKHPVGLVYAVLEGISPLRLDMATRILREFTSPPVTLACRHKGKKMKPSDEVDIIWPLKKDILTVELVDTRSGTDTDLMSAINESNIAVD